MGESGIKLKGTLFLHVYLYVFLLHRGWGVITHAAVVSAGFDKIAAASTNECLRCPFFLSSLMCAAGKQILKGPLRDTSIHEMTI